MLSEPSVNSPRIVVIQCEYINYNIQNEIPSMRFRDSYSVSV